MTIGQGTIDRYDAMIAAYHRREAERNTAMPTTEAALAVALDAKERLRRLGWRDGIYCPKDGSTFALIEWGSTGVHSGHYMGQWPKGRIYACDFLVPPEEVMWKPIDALTDDERAAMQRSDADTRAFIDRLGAAAEAASDGA